MQYPELHHLSQRWLSVRLLRISRHRPQGRYGEDGRRSQDPGMVGHHGTDAATARHAPRRRMVGVNGGSMASRLTKLSLLFLALVPAGLLADVTLPALISDHMVLQQDAPVRIWGTADGGEAVSVAFQGQKVTTKADATGKWSVFLMPLKAGGPGEMTIDGKHSITIHDVLVGEVWIGSGQSNMELPMTRVRDADAEIAAANFPQIRLFTVKKKVSETPLDDVVGEWSLCTPESTRNFSAVGYFFSRYIHQNRHVPVGFIHSSWGGTPAESWTSRPIMDGNAQLKPILEDW